MLDIKSSNQTNLKEILIREIEQTSDDVLKEVLDFLLFVRIRHAKKPPAALSSEAPHSTAKYILDNLDNIGTWEGDDFDECLQMVKDSRSKVNFFKHKSF